MPDQDAAYWAVQLAAAGDDPTVRSAAERWLADDPRRSGQLLRAQAMLHLASTPALAPAAAAAVPIKAPIQAAISPVAANDFASHHAPAALTRRQMLGGGALLAAGMAAGLIAWDNRGQISTDVGEFRQVSLADGSSVALNTDSLLQVRFNQSERRLFLRSGEALFHVAKAADRPFVVVAGDVIITAIGTILSVLREANMVVVLVTEGAVDVQHGDRLHVRLTAGQQGRFGAPDAASASGDAGPVAEQAISILSPAAAARSLAWRDGRLEFAGETVEQAIAMANRYSRRPIELADPALGVQPLHGAFRTTDTTGLARTIAVTLGQPIIETPDRLVIGRRAAQPG